MTEAVWNGCTQPLPLLVFLGGNGRANERKLRLFTCACCRRVWNALRDERSRHAVEVAEKFADGQVGQPERRHVREVAWHVVDWDAFGLVCGWAATAATLAVSDGAEIVWDLTGRLLNPLGQPETPAGKAAGGAFTSALAAAWTTYLRELHFRATWSVWRRAWRWVSSLTKGLEDSTRFLHALPVEQNKQAFLLRDLFGPLLFRDIRIAPGWLAWGDGTVRKLAQGIYDERMLPQGLLDPSRLAILADALEEAGCDNEEILSHCRQQDAVHVRGCWLIDLLLAKA